MAKSVAEVLKGVKKSETQKLDLGGMTPKAPAEKDWVAVHAVQKHADRVGNEKAPYVADTKYVLDLAGEDRHGKTEAEAKKVYEDVEKDLIAAHGRRSKKDLMDQHQRFKMSIESLPKNAKYSAHAHLTDKEYWIRTALKRHHNTEVDKPKHPLVSEEAMTKAICNGTREGVPCPVHKMADCNGQVDMNKKKLKSIRESLNTSSEVESKETYVVNGKPLSSLLHKGGF